MSTDVNVHVNNEDTLTARVVNFPSSVDPFVTFELNSGGNGVTIYVRKLDDAKRVFEAAKNLVRAVHDLELQKLLDVEVESL